jgi:ribulose-bisphosphate carboxylase large chain
MELQADNEQLRKLISGERFSVVYCLQGSEAEARRRAEDICLEQTVEFPEEFVPEGLIRDEILGRIESMERFDQGSFRIKISYAVESTAMELTQLLNVIFGNISIKPGIRVEEISLPVGLLRQFKGPRFGREGLRRLLRVPTRPLLFTALKPMGLSASKLAELAYRFALGGIDIIKDDHGLSDQSFAPFQERLTLCTEAVNRANQETGRHAIYVPNVTASYPDLMKRARLAKQAGAGGLLVAPGLTGLDAMKTLADDDEIALPIFSHPAFQGSYVIGTNGISHYALYGQIMRLAGADASIYPNFGGRFSFTREECQKIVEGTAVPMGPLRSIFPSPGGGMSIDSIPAMNDVYGQDVIFLIGGGLFKQGPDLIENCRHFRDLVEKYYV